MTRPRPPIVMRLSAEQMIARKQSMLREIPSDYARVETTQEALKAAVPSPPTVTLRITIVWDNDASNLDLERVLDHMRETGAAMVLSVEQVT